MKTARWPLCSAMKANKQAVHSHKVELHTIISFTSARTSSVRVVAFISHSQLTDFHPASSRRTQWSGSDTLRFLCRVTEPASTLSKLNRWWKYKRGRKQDRMDDTWINTKTDIGCVNKRERGRAERVFRSRVSGLKSVEVWKGSNYGHFWIEWTQLVCR